MSELNYFSAIEAKTKLFVAPTNNTSTSLQRFHGPTLVLARSETKQTSREPLNSVTQLVSVVLLFCRLFRKLQIHHRQ